MQDARALSRLAPDATNGKAFTALPAPLGASRGSARKLLVAASLIVLATGSLIFFSRATPEPSLRALPLTTYPGFETGVGHQNFAPRMKSDGCEEG
jgi:hypothetical protein